MADKTTGELTAVNVSDLPAAADIYDDFKMPGELQGEAVHVTGSQIKDYAVAAGVKVSEVFAESVKADANAATASKENAAASAKAAALSATAADNEATAAAVSAEKAASFSTLAQNALTGVQNAIDNIPAGSTPIVNDLTTGGTKMALSAEMGKVLGYRPNPNLLDNAYFVNPVNQRGQAKYSGAGYSFDRWQIRKGSSAASDDDVLTVEVNDGVGIEISNTSPTSQGWYAQLFEPRLPYGTYTLSILVSEVGFSDPDYDPSSDPEYDPDASTASMALYNSGGSYGTSYSIKKAGLITATREVSESKNHNASFRIAVFKGRRLVITAIKLERGSTQTLAHQDADGNWVLNEIPDYGMELLKCQRYFQLFSSEDAIPKNLANFRPNMRINPTIGTIDIDGVTYRYADAEL